MDIKEILSAAVASGVSDIFIIAGAPLSFKINGVISVFKEGKLLPRDTEALIGGVYSLSGRPNQRFLSTGDDDFSFSLPGLARFRISVYRQRGSGAAVIRIIPFGIPDYRKLNIPDCVIDVHKNQNGIVLVTGPAGSGKSTTLACIIDAINATRTAHIITLENPIEYLHSNKKSIISQREIELDTESYISALRASLRQAPDVILLGEMRDYETIRTAVTAAETGHLVISTLHTLGASNTVDRIVDVFPPDGQHQIRVQLSMLLRSIISQQLVPAKNGGVLPAFELMHATSAIRNLIREGKTHQLDTMIALSSSDGMFPMDSYLLSLFEKGLITAETALSCALSPENLRKKLPSASRNM